MTITLEIKRSLSALYTTVLVKNKYGQDNDTIHRYKMHAEDLDGLGVPFLLQNLVASAGEKRTNWDRYNSSVIDEAIEKFKTIIKGRA